MIRTRGLPSKLLTFIFVDVMINVNDEANYAQSITFADEIGIQMSINDIGRWSRMRIMNCSQTMLIGITKSGLYLPKIPDLRIMSVTQS